jgi:hypothetical protein
VSRTIVYLPTSFVMTDSTSHKPTAKACNSCVRTLPFANFSMDKRDPIGLQSMCKECFSDSYKRNKEKADRKRTDHVGDEGREEGSGDASEEPSTKRPRLVPDPPVSGADLYVMALSFDPEGAIHGLKVGRSGNVQQRAMSLSDSMPFTILVLAIFPGAGGLEKEVHSHFESKRVTKGRGREWFHVPLPTIMRVVARVMEQRVDEGPITA